MKKLPSIVALLCLLSWGRAASPRAQGAGLAQGFGPDWKPAFSMYLDSNNLVEYVHKGDSAEDWKESITIQSFDTSLKISPEALAEKQKTQREKECPGLTQWNVIAKDGSSILYEWHAGPCNKRPEEIEIERAMIAKYDWYALHYSARVHELAPDARAQWIKTLSDATIDSVIRSFDPLRMQENVDAVIPYAMDRVMAALKPAMESQECSVSSTAPGRIECKRTRVTASFKHPASGGESVTAEFEADGDRTHIGITTGKGIYGRLEKTNWSTPIYDEMMKDLQRDPQ